MAVFGKTELLRQHEDILKDFLDFPFELNHDD